MQSNGLYRKILYAGLHAETQPLAGGSCKRSPSHIQSMFTGRDGLYRAIRLSKEANRHDHQSRILKQPVFPYCTAQKNAPYWGGALKDSSMSDAVQSIWVAPFSFVLRHFRGVIADFFHSCNDLNRNGIHRPKVNCNRNVLLSVLFLYAAEYLNLFNECVW